MTDLRSHLEARHVSPPIIDRVLRMNPNHHPGRLLRGLHYKSMNDPRWLCGAMTRGEAIRRFGRAAAENMPRSAVIKRGRRVFYTWEAVQDRAWEHHPGMVYV